MVKLVTMNVATTTATSATMPVIVNTMNKKKGKEIFMIRDNNLENRINKKLEKLNSEIQKGNNIELRTEQKNNLIRRLNHIKHIRRTIATWEHANNLWFNGSENDVYTFKDLMDYCNELQFNEKPLDIIREGIFIPIGGSAITPYDLREYLFLPSSLIEEDKDIKTIHEAFKGFGEDIVQL